ncbi:MAG: cation transporter [Gemmatales bacterium]|nr:MAG: cation transporter [Gemmatales bacterium]
MASAFFEFLASASIIVIAGTFLTRYADAIAELTKLGRLLVGSIFLASATSLPELSVDVSAARQGLPDLAVGDLMGSSLINLLILGLLDLSHQAKGRMLSRQSAAHALSATMSMVLAALAGIAIVSRIPFHVAGIGAGSIALAVVYVLGLRIVYYDQRYSSPHPEETESADLMPTVQETLTLPRAIIGYCIAALVIILAAPYVAESAGELADRSGLGGTFVGTTLVALSTSLPELVTTFAAVRLGAFDLALGNIFGSNSFNMVLLLPVDMAYSGSLLASVSPTHAVTCLSAILITCVAVMGQLYHAEKRLRFVEPDAALIILLVLSALGLVYFLRS